MAVIYGRLVPYALNASTIQARELPPSTAFDAIRITIAIFKLDATHLLDEGKLRGDFIQFLDYVLRFHACIVLLSIYNIVDIYFLEWAAAGASEASSQEGRVNDPSVQTHLQWRLYGNWEKEAQSPFSHLASHMAIISSSHKCKALTEIYSRLNFSLVRAMARALLARCAPFLGLLDIP